MEKQKSVWLNNFEFPVISPIRWSKITPFPSQLAISSPTVNDYTPTKKQSWSALKGGMGISKWSAENNDRYAEADGVDASLNMQSLAPLVTTLGSFGTEPAKIIKFNGRIWAIGHNRIAYWNSSAWIVVKSDFPNPTDAITYYGTTVA